MSRKKFIIFSIILLGVSILFIIFMMNKKDDTFDLEERYYNNLNENNLFSEIDSQELNGLISNKESFAVFIYQPMCVTSSDFEQVLHDFQQKYSVSFHKIAFSVISDTVLGEKIKYYPSFAIFRDGKLVDYLESNKNEDIEYYKSSDGFKKWFTKFVNLKDYTNNTNNNENQYNTENFNQNNIDLEYGKIELDNIKQEENKINICFFWGNGCPHCEEEMKFFESIEKQYGKYYNLYKFETWYNEENAKIFEIFANAMSDKANGVPYTIIGKKSFSGFGKSSEEEFIKAIEDQYQDNYDIYFDKIKK